MLFPASTNCRGIYQYNNHPTRRGGNFSIARDVLTSLEPVKDLSVTMEEFSFNSSLDHRVMSVPMSR